jgi:hypothetical protein
LKALELLEKEVLRKICSPKRIRWSVFKRAGKGELCDLNKSPRTYQKNPTGKANCGYKEG